jgi:hypothetical protein
MRKVLEGFDFKYQSHTFNEDDFAAMAEALGISSLNDEQRKILQKQCDRFLPLVASWDQASRPNEVRKKLEAVHSDVERLMKNLHSLHDPDAPDKAARQSTLALLHSAAPDNDWNDCYEDNMFAFTERLTELAKATNTALNELPGNKGGPPGDLPLKGLTDALAELFTEITKKNPSISTNPYAEPEEEFGGKFLGFVEIFLRPLPLQRPKRRRDLGLALKRILLDRKRS